MAAPEAQSRPLTTKQELFVAAYLGDAHGNATAAARMAGYKNPKPSAQNNMANHAILARVKQHVDQAGATADAVLRKLAEIAFAPSFEFIEVVGRDKAGKPTKVKMDLSNQVKSLELLGKYHQLFTERQQIEMDIRDHRVVGVPQADLDALFQPAKRADA